MARKYNRWADVRLRMPYSSDDKRIIRWQADELDKLMAAPNYKPNRYTSDVRGINAMRKDKPRSLTDSQWHMLHRHFRAIREGECMLPQPAHVVMIKATPAAAPVPTRIKPPFWTRVMVALRFVFAYESISSVPA